jgi:hypothetical protein
MLGTCKIFLHGFDPSAIGATPILDAIAHGDSVPLEDAIQLRNWADRPKDSLRPLAEIARAILDRLEHSNVKVG